MNSFRGTSSRPLWDQGLVADLLGLDGPAHHAGQDDGLAGDVEAREVVARVGLGVVELDRLLHRRGERAAALDRAHDKAQSAARAGLDLQDLVPALDQAADRRDDRHPRADGGLVPEAVGDQAHELLVLVRCCPRAGPCWRAPGTSRSGCRRGRDRRSPRGPRRPRRPVSYPARAPSAARRPAARSRARRACRHPLSGVSPAARVPPPPTPRRCRRRPCSVTSIRWRSSQRLRSSSTICATARPTWPMPIWTISSRFTRPPRAGRRGLGTA